jgi:transcriptional regulator with XRE-family HTH domain
MVNKLQRADIGKVLKQRRRSLLLTIREISEKSGVSASHLSRIEKGNRFPSASVLRRIAEPLGYEELDLMMEAGYLSPLKSDDGEGKEGRRLSKLDPYVAGMLSQEPVEVQRSVIQILSIIKRIGALQEQTEK